MFLSVWVPSGPLRYHTKLKAKQVNLVQLMQKFVPGCLVRVILNERSRSTPLDPKLMFWCNSFRFSALGPFRYCTKLGAKRAKLVQLMQKYVPRCLVGIFHKELSRSTPLDPKLLFWCVSFLVGCIWDRFATAQNLL